MRRGSENSIVDPNDIDLSKNINLYGEGNIGLDGGIELVRSPSFLNRLDVQTIKDLKTSPTKKQGAKSEMANYGMTDVKLDV